MANQQSLLEKAEDLQKADAGEILEWALKIFKDKVALASSFGAEDVVLVDMLAKINPKARVFTLDTGRLPQETYDVFAKIRDKYGIEIETYFPATAEVEDMIAKHGPNGFYESIELRKLCCQIRKMNPLKRAFSGLDAWICGLRREQSPTRTEVRKVEIDESQNPVVKINPLADWSEEEVWSYIKENDIPYNSLHDQGFPSIGCLPCTRAVKPGEDIRAGRWWWEDPDRKECGLHVKEE